MAIARSKSPAVLASKYRFKTLELAEEMAAALLTAKTMSSKLKKLELRWSVGSDGA
jgi:hypothetical protein